MEHHRCWTEINLTTEFATVAANQAALAAATECFSVAPADEIITLTPPLTQADEMSIPVASALQPIVACRF